jgi:hypothetical protein
MNAMKMSPRDLKISGKWRGKSRPLSVGASREAVHVYLILVINVEASPLEL